MIQRDFYFQHYEFAQLTDRIVRILNIFNQELNSTYSCLKIIVEPVCLPFGDLILNSFFIEFRLYMCVFLCRSL